MDWKKFVKWFIDNGHKPDKTQRLEWNYKLKKRYDLKYCELNHYYCGVLGGFLYSESWICGGQGGGSCWDDGTEDNHYSISSEYPPNSWLLHKFLEDNYPNLTFLQYRRIEELFEYTESSENEYYGNYTDHRRYKVNLKKLYETLEGIPAPSTPKIKERKNK